jgi:ribonucleoside-diphosphate reductase alpha chain
MGTGFSFSRLRAKGSTVNSTQGVSSGPISFMKVFNAATEAVKQGGTRRGANMGILRVDHPDIMEFITCKADNSEITNFNISVGITEEFMQKVEKELEYDLIDPRTKTSVGKLNAKKVFDLIVEMAWKNGEPGIIFLDRINEENPTPELGEIESTNPCGEQPLLPYEACNLGSINLSNMLIDIDGKLCVDFNKLVDVADTATHFLDNVITVNNYPIPEIEKMTKATRKIGLGVMGWADMLCKLNIPYNSPEALELGRRIMTAIHNSSFHASCKLARLKGTFPAINQSRFAIHVEQPRNATVSTIAPTGTLSIIAGVSSGIEPLFAISYIRNVMDGEELVEVNPLFKEVAIREGFYSEDLMKRIAKKGTIQEFEEIPKHIRDIFVTAHDVSPEYHVDMQASFQDTTDNAVSKTVNLCNSATKEDVRKVYMRAYRSCCKGVTIYRDGSRDMQVLNISEVKGKEKREESAVDSETIIQPRERPDVTTGLTEKVKIGCGNLYVTANYDDKGICEVFTNTGRAGGCPSQSEATSRLISIALRAGIDCQSIIEQLKGIRCPSTIRQKGMKVTSCPDAIGRLLEKVNNMQKNLPNQKDLDITFTANKYESPQIEKLSKTMESYYGSVNEENIEVDRNSKYCPECNTEVEHEGGCMVCRNCGFSKCG